jgi:PPOX class probable FMN-dependent enzyme
VSPRGGPPGFVQVIDEHRLAIPDLNGNNLLDTITNIVANPHVGLLFVLPGRDETLRVNGRAWLTTDDVVLDGFTAELKRPKAAIGVAVEQAFVHCAKSFRRGRVWDPASWVPDAAPSAAELLTCHVELEATPEQVAADLEIGYAHDLAADRA